MKKTIALGSLFVVLTGLSGCGSSPDSLVEQQIALMNDMADAIENDASKEEIEALKKRGDALSEKMEKLELSDAEKDRLRERYEDDIKEATSRLLKASMGRAMKDVGNEMPGLPQGGL